MLSSRLYDYAVITKMSVDSHAADMSGTRPAVETPAVPAITVRKDDTNPAQAAGPLVALEIFAAILCVLIVSLGSYQLHFTLPVVGFVLFLIVVVTAIQ